MLNPIIVKAIFIAAQTTMEYIPGEGALCPVCLKIYSRRTRGRVTSSPGDGVRYCHCEPCDINFKAVERIESAVVVVKTTQTVDAKPKKRQSKNKRG